MNADGMPQHRRVQPVTISGVDPRERGRSRGALLGEQIRRTAAAYRDLFLSLGIPEQAQREASGASMEALRSWAPVHHDELMGVAEAAGLDLVDLGTTVARTEILTLADEFVPECSLLVHRDRGSDSVGGGSGSGTGTGTVSAQTWDWYASFVDVWHPQRVKAVAGQHAHVGFTEYGMPAKIGLNSAVVGVHLNILKHRDDGPGGVPVHGILARLSAEAVSVADGVEIVRSAAASTASTTSSSTITLVSPDDAAMVEIAAGQVSVLTGSGWTGEGWLGHTNHFLAPDLQDGAMLLDPTSKTRDRLDRLERWSETAAVPRSAADLAPVLCPVPAPGVGLLPDLTQPAAARLATLVTVEMEPAQRRVRITPGVAALAEDATLTLEV